MALVLDDYLSAVADLRRRFQLASPTVGLVQIKAESVARQAMEAIINETTDRHGPDIYSKPHSLLAADGSAIYAEFVKTEAYSGH